MEDNSIHCRSKLVNQGVTSAVSAAHLQAKARTALVRPGLRPLTSNYMRSRRHMPAFAAHAAGLQHLFAALGSVRSRFARGTEIFGMNAVLLQEHLQVRAIHLAATRQFRYRAAHFTQTFF